MEQLIINVNNIVLGFVQGSFGSLSGTVHALWYLMFIVFIAVYGYKIMISGRFSASDIIVHCLKIIVLLVLATDWNTFFLFIYRMVTDMPSDLAGQIMQGASAGFGSAADPVTVNTALSQFYARSLHVASLLLEGASWSQTGLYLYAFLVWLGALVFTGYAMMLIILSKLAVAVLLAVGPLFILLLMFTNTRKLFEGWLRTLLNYALIPVFVYVLLAILLTLAESPLRYMELHSGVYDQFLTSIGSFLMICVVSAMLLGQVMGMAASVTGGVALSTMGAALLALRASKAVGAKTATGGTVIAKTAWKNRTKAKDYVIGKAKAGHVALKQALNRRSEAL